MPKLDEPKAARTYNQDHTRAEVREGAAPGERLRRLELPRGGQSKPDGARQPVLDDDRGAAGALACLRGAAMGPAEVPAGDRRGARAVLLGVGAVPARRRGGHRQPGPHVPARRSGGLRAPARRAGAGRHRHAVRLRPRSHGHRSRCPRRPRSRRSARSSNAKGPASSSARTTTSGSRRTCRNATWSTCTTATRWCRASSASARYTRALMKGLGIPVENRWGLRPAVIAGENGRIAPLTIAKDLDERGWLAGVRNFNFHMHLPHYAVTAEDARSVHVLARQPIDLSRPHPFTNAGNKEFNTLVWMPPEGGGRATCWWSTPRSSARCSAPTRASSASGGTSRRPDSAVLELDDIQSGVLRPRPSAVRRDLHPAPHRRSARRARADAAPRRRGRVGGAPDEPGGRHLGQRRAHLPGPEGAGRAAGLARQLRLGVPAGDGGARRRARRHRREQPRALGAAARDRATCTWSWPRSRRIARGSRRRSRGRARRSATCRA